MTDVPTTDEPLLRVHPNARLAWIGGSLVTVAVVTAIACVAEVAVASSRGDWPWPTWLPVFGLAGGVALAALSTAMCVAQYRRFGYALRERDLVVQSGVFWQVRRCVPRARVQHVDVQSGPIDRALGLTELRVYVAGSGGAVATIGGVTPAAAEQLKEALIVERSDIVEQADGV